MVPAARAEEARAVMLELFPEGFEEVDAHDGIELAAYASSGGEERLWQAFGAGSAEDVPADWLDRWRRFHRPVTVGEVWIGPPWLDPPPGLAAVTIDPGRAFGTGSHPTTRLCLELLHDLPRGSLLDVGCGSGVLAIAAARLGFGPVTALDVDPHAVEAAERNAAANGATVEVLLADGAAAALPSADVTVANISRDVVEALAPSLASPLAVISGYLLAEQPVLAGYVPRRRVERDGWAADLFARGE
jgi:ribosomal protein L11 methyltransferase